MRKMKHVHSKFTMTMKLFRSEHSIETFIKILSIASNTTHLNHFYFYTNRTTLINSSIRMKIKIKKAKPISHMIDSHECEL